MPNGIWAPESLESFVEHPLRGFFDRLVKHIGQKWYSGQSELEANVNDLHDLGGRIEQLHTPIGPQVRIVEFFAFLSALPEYLTILWIVNAGRPMLARPWKTARSSITVL